MTVREPTPTKYPTREELEARRLELVRGDAGELLSALELEVAELREQVADLHLRLERLAAIVGGDEALGSRSIESESEHTPDTTARLREYLRRTGRLAAVDS